MARARAVTLTNYMEVARFVGLDPQTMLGRAGIDAITLEDPENWLPGSNVLNLLEDSAALSGRDDFSVLLAKCRTFTSLGPVSLLMKHEATVEKIIRAAAEYRHLINDLLHIKLTDDGRSAIVAWTLSPGLHSAQGINLISTIAYRCISEALESQWEPDCIHFRHAAPVNFATFSRFFRCPLEFGSNFDGLSCSSSGIQTRNRSADSNLAAHARRLLNLLPHVRQESAADKVRSTIALLIDDGEATAERVADCLGVEVRTLQRKLIAEDLTFTKLRNEVRRELVIRCLTGPARPLSQVAQLAGYSSSAALTRWFTQEFGTPPKRWRAKHQAKFTRDLRAGLTAH